VIDRESAYERLEEKALASEKAADAAEAKKAAEKADAKKAKEEAAEQKRSSSSRGRKKSAGDVISYEAKLMARQLLRTQGRRILRGVLGGLIRR